MYLGFRLDRVLLSQPLESSYYSKTFSLLSSVDIGMLPNHVISLCCIVLLFLGMFFSIFLAPTSSRNIVSIPNTWYYEFIEKN